MAASGRCGNAGEAAERLHRLAEQRFLAGDLAGALRAAREAQARCRTPLTGLDHALAAAGMSRASGRNWYAVLSVGARTSLPIDGVTHDDIKRRYKRLCLVLHPDKNPSAAADGAFKLLQEAWKTLSVRHPPTPCSSAAGAKPRPVPTPPPARTRPPAPSGSAAKPSSNHTRRAPPPPAPEETERRQAGDGGTFDSRSRPRARSPRSFRGGLCGHCWRKFYAAADGEEEELCMPCRERAREPTAPPAGADTPDRDTPSPPRRGSRRFPCPGLCAHCGAGYASSMVSVGMWNLHCSSCHRYAKVHVRSPSSAEVW
ncbi:hypothetical protein ACQ4PT_070569 [Festuca glaucescens]